MEMVHSAMSNGLSITQTQVLTGLTEEQIKEIVKS